MSTTPDIDTALTTEILTHSSAAKENVRQSLASYVEAFLVQGGQIAAIPKDFRADPPKKPENNYGRGSI
ncbi:MAG: hypothetical protein FJ194_01210 [Gammaproteobacteria bacterium]|nr:hypothetical protein [Gammaproteobacteria bacterium]